MLRLLASWRALPPCQPSSRARNRRAPQRVAGRLGPERVAQLVTDYEAGTPTTELTHRYKLGKGSVLRLLDAHGAPKRRQRLEPAEIAEVVRLYGQGWSLARIGARFNRHHSVILRILDRAGVPRRSHGRSR